MEIKLNGKALLGLGLLSTSLVLADFVSVVDVKSSGGITVEQVAETAPVGSIMMWVTNTPPEGWVEMRGQSTSSYPELATVIGGTIPDMRGNFARGWNNDGSLDSGRTIGSSQTDAIRNITGNFQLATGAGRNVILSASDVFELSGSGSGASESASQGTRYRTINFDASNMVPTAEENRPYNVALMYIIKAE